MTDITPAVRAYQAAHLAFEKIKVKLWRLLEDNLTIDDSTLDTYKEARNALTQAQDTLPRG